MELVKGAVVEIGKQTIFRVEFEEEAEEKSARKDHCSLLLLLRTYMLEALNKINDIQQGKKESLEDL